MLTPERAASHRQAYVHCSIILWYIRPKRNRMGEAEEEAEHLAAISSVLGDAVRIRPEAPKLCPKIRVFNLDFYVQIAYIKP
jgi:hypothetical protein